MAQDRTDSFVGFVYRFRWLLALATMALMTAMAVGGFTRVARFSKQVDSLRVPPPESPEPMLFDMRSDIWFDPSDSALTAYRYIEDRFVGDDPLFVGFEENEDPWGVFGKRALITIARLTQRLEKVRYVRNVRSVTSNPWIRWGEIAPGEEGLLVSDLFEKDPATYTDDERLVRMIAVLGAKRSSKLAGEKEVRRVLGPDANFDDYMGEPRLVGGIISEDGRSTLVLAQVLRPRVTDEQRAAVFGSADSIEKAAGPALFSASTQSAVAVAVKKMMVDEKDYDFRVSGQPVMQDHFQTMGKKDMGYTGLVFLAIAIVLLLIYRRVGGAFLPLLIVASSVIGMVGFTFVTGKLINNLTAMTPNILTAVGTADAVHLVTAYYLFRPHFSDKQALLHEVLRHNALPVFLTSVTTAIGFLSLATSGLAPMHEFGIATGVGTVFAYLLSMTVIPALLSLLPVKKSHKGQSAPSGLSSVDQPHWSDRLVKFVLARRKSLIVATGLAILVAVIGISRVNITNDMRLMFPSDDPQVANLRWIDRHIGGTGDLELLFKGPESQEKPEVAQARQARIGALEVKRLTPETGALSAAEHTELKELRIAEANYKRRRIADNGTFLGEVARFEARLTQEGKNPDSPLRVITNVDSALDVLRKMHQVQNKNSAAWYRIPTEADVPLEARKPRVLHDDIEEEDFYVPAQSAATMISQYYLQFENGAKPSENLASMMTTDRVSFRLSMRTSIGSSDLMLGAYKRIRDIADKEFPLISGTVEQVESGEAMATMVQTGRFFMSMRLLGAFTKTLVVSLSLALLVITLLIGAVFRSPVIALVSMIPNVLPIMVPLGIIGLIGLPFDGPAVLVASVALGICVDDTIHFLTKFSDAQKMGLGAEASLRYTFRAVGSALTWTSVVLVIGFSMLAFANFRPNVLTGILGAIMIAMAWLADFTLTPALLSYFGNRKTVAREAGAAKQAA